MTLADALRAIRGDASQQAMAEGFGRTQAWWSRIESGAREPRVDDLVALSRRFGLVLRDGEWEPSA